MKLEKITDGDRRCYPDACGTAHALDLIGERWALLVIREMLLGPRRFADLRESMPGISANVLTQRLKWLETVGVVQRRKLAPPASVQVYELTEWGREAEPVIVALGRWGARSPFQDVSQPLSAVGMVMSFRAMFDPSLAEGVEAKIAFSTEREAYSFTISRGALVFDAGVDTSAQARLCGTPGQLASAVYGIRPLEELEREGVRIDGERAAFLRFTSAFSLPPKVAWEGRAVIAGEGT